MSVTAPPARSRSTTSPLRSRPAIRRFLEGPALTPADLSMVLLVTEKQADRPMPTLTVPEIPAAMREARLHGIRSVKIFAESARRDATGEISLVPDALMARAVRAAKDTEPDLAVMTETCLCSYTDSGLCYVTDVQGRPDIPATIDVTARQAVAHAVAGADIVGPASMVLGTTQGARTALNDQGYGSVSVMPHVIFWSSLYDGFRRTMGATPKAGVDREFQINPGKPEQFIDAALQLVQDGADMLLLEPAMFTADVLTHLKQHTRAPLFPFSVSGEYTALTSLDAKTGRRDVRRLIELFTMLKRAGADASVTYAALDIARQLSG
ncbi:porphobilinogen synthase [Streptomyces botrytidirepellens]|uniref:Delta-aminolevulinic acid dehydratase n=1 Tax=Streptomyces botrytidirepellens TaxID=2486417 RepID=A0A3M8VMN8_9ACTN|nr:porphobilinogen synthase [Streptomyces botrytidirepellens]RNG17741.1 porphobilinogen synthase [Streptomyces botrytidirepellens]